MAQGAAHGEQASPAQVQNAAAGRKRAAEAPLENEQRLSKRFDLLNLVDNNGTRLYIPVPGSQDTTPYPPTTNAVPIPHPLAGTFPLQKAQSKVRPPRLPPTNNDGMDLEDTPHRVYIHDLAAELSDIESDEEHPIFLSDIEKHLSKIPKHVLLGPEPKTTETNQLVLYNVPASLSVPEDQDGVRKAIVEARQRIREKQANVNPELEREPVGKRGMPGPAIVHDAINVRARVEDVDAMDID